MHSFVRSKTLINDPEAKKKKKKKWSGREDSSRQCRGREGEVREGSEGDKTGCGGG